MSNLTLRGNPAGAGTFILESPNSANSRTITLPDASTTLVGTDATQTLTNKTIQGGALTLGTAQASTSGTAIDFTGIPSWVKRITVMLNGVSLSGTSNLLIQIGSGSVQSTGYVAGATQSNNATVQTSTAGFVLTSGLVASSAIYGNIALTLVTGNTWSSGGVLWNTSNAGHTNAGSVSLSGALDRIRITTVNGTDTFDAGTINIMYEG